MGVSVSSELRFCFIVLSSVCSGVLSVVIVAGGCCFGWLRLVTLLGIVFGLSRSFSMSRVLCMRVVLVVIRLLVFLVSCEVIGLGIVVIWCLVFVVKLVVVSDFEWMVVLIMIVILVSLVMIWLWVTKY